MSVSSSDDTQSPITGPAALKGRKGFLPGRSGNPAGRPVGSKNHKTRMLEKFEQMGAEVADVVVEKALEGNISACHLVLTRLYPPLRPRSQTVQFELDAKATLVEQGAAILSAIAAGNLDPDTGRMLMGCVQTLAGLKEIDELAARINVLEGRFAQQPATSTIEYI